jgi:hypothetical protein
MPSVETDPMVSVFERAVQMLDTVLGEIAERGDTEQYLCQAPNIMNTTSQYNC